MPTHDHSPKPRRHVGRDGHTYMVTRTEAGPHTTGGPSVAFVFTRDDGAVHTVRVRSQSPLHLLTAEDLDGILTRDQPRSGGGAHVELSPPAPWVEPHGEGGAARADGRAAEVSERRARFPETEVLVIQTVDGELFRVVEREGTDTLSYVEKIANAGAWVTGHRRCFVPAHRIAKVEITDAAGWEQIREEMQRNPGPRSRWT